ncbi:MAG: exo-alpha-sialidase [Planctomycetes bacterium]|nr:exo-alpha-sialidase [Planctomycetota bacterium]
MSTHLPLSFRCTFALCALLSCAPAQEAPTTPAPPTPQLLFAELGALAQPQLAVRADGALALAFVGPKSAIHVAVRSPGADWSAPRLLGEEPNLAAGMRRGPRIAWAGEALVVSYIASRFDREKRKVVGTGNLYARRSTDGGASWSSPVQVNGGAGSAAEGLHAMAAHGDGVVIVWLDPRGEPQGMKLFAARSEDGGKSFAKDVPIYTSPSKSICECCHPSIALGADGTTRVLWRNQIDGHRDMFVGTLGPKENQLVAVEPCGTKRWKLPACPMDGGGLALGASELPISVWRRESLIYATHGATRELLLGEGKNAAVAARGSHALVVWENDGILACASLDSPSAERSIVLRALGAGAYASVAALPEDSFLVVAERPRERGLAAWRIKD